MQQSPAHMTPTWSHHRARLSFSIDMRHLRHQKKTQKHKVFYSLSQRDNTFIKNTLPKPPYDPDGVASSCASVIFYRYATPTASGKLSKFVFYKHMTPKASKKTYKRRRCFLYPREDNIL